ncbi:MAG: hypothetical protein A3J83_01965, partial [Elusimicrobia bacterium RIFOXYA2_FULL_40_6]
MKNIKIPLFLKFVVIMIALSVGPLVFVGIRTVNINKLALQTSILELHTQIAKSFSEKIDYYITEIQNEVPYITQVLSVPELSYQIRDVALQAILDSHQNIASISLLDKKGQEKVKVYNPVFEKEAKLLNYKEDADFNIIKEGKIARVMSQVYLKNDKPFLNVYYRLNQNLNILIVLNLQPLWDELQNIHLGNTGYAFIVDAQGNVIAHKDKSLLFKKLPNVPIINQAIHSLSIGSSEYYNQLTKEIMICAYAPSKNFGWSVIVEQPKKEAYYSSIIMQRQAVFLIIGSIILSAGIAFLIARNLTRPVLELIKSANRIANHDFSTTVNLKTNDELNDLITTFNVMTGELRRYEEMQVDKLVAEKTKTDAVIFSIADGIIMTDYDGKILLANHQARNMFNVSQENLEGQVLWDYLTDRKIADTFTEIIREYKESEGTIYKEMDLSSDDVSRYFKTTTEPVTTVKGEKLGIVTVVRDVTLEKEIERMKDDFMHSITHDLRNPMTSIRGFLKFLMDGIGGPLTDQQKKMIDTMDRASLRLMGLINDILDLAKLESGRMDLQLTDTNLFEISNRVIELLQPQIAKKVLNVGIELVNTSVSPVLKADPMLIERVINNLVGNAIKFTPENGKITVKIVDYSDKIEVRVADTGEGIPPEYLDRIFDKFQQVAGQKKGGTGLGLTICKYIMNSHKGKIWVESKMKEGSTFIFSLPKNLS